MAFKRAAKRDARLRFGFIGPAGSGKTRTALELASRIGKKIAVIDSERGRSRAYSDRFEFDVDDELPDFSPANYMKAIKAAEDAGYDVIVVDSGSHEWAGKGGVLGIVDIQAARSGNKFTAWAVGTPAHQSFIDALLQCKAHLIITFRARTEWVLEPGANGKMTPRAIGMGAVAREGTEFELDFVGLLDLDHKMTLVKTTNAAELEGKIYHMPAQDLADDMLRWLSTNTVAPSPAPVPAKVAAKAAEPATGEEVTNGAASPHAAEGAKSSGGPIVSGAGGGSMGGAEALVTAGTNPASPSFAERIAAAKTEKELRDVGVDIGRAKVAGKEREELLASYVARLAALGQQAAA